ncbi:MAG: YIP1 family protein [Desulfohalobiaceae bacterium]
MQVECPHCGFSRDVPEEKIPPQATVATCPKCRQKFAFRSTGQEEQAEQQEQEGSGNDSGLQQETVSSYGDQQPGQEQDDSDIWDRLESLQEEESPGPKQEAAGQKPAWEVPWEDLQEHGFFPGLWLTIKLVLLAPVGFFSRMPVQGGFIMPLIFYLLIAEVQVLSIFFWRMAGVLPNMQDDAASIFGLALTGAGAFSLLLLYPLIMAAYVFFYTGVSHLCLLAVQSGKNGFEGTFRVIAYANAPMLLGVVPVLGPWAGFVWALVCTFFGFRLVHETPGPRVLLAMVLPYLFIILLSLILLGLGQGF